MSWLESINKYMKRVKLINRCRKNRWKSAKPWLPNYKDKLIKIHKIRVN